MVGGNLKPPENMVGWYEDMNAKIVKDIPRIYSLLLGRFSNS